MKKIFKFIILLVICIIPAVGEAKAKLSYEWKVHDNEFVGSINGKYYLFSYDIYGFKIYDKNGKFIENDTDSLDYLENFLISNLYNNEIYANFFEYDEGQIKYNKNLNKYYTVNYYDSCVYVLGDKISDDYVEYDFSLDFELVSTIMSKEFELYNDLVSDGYFVYNVRIEEGFYIVYAYNESTNKNLLCVLDSSLNVIYNQETYDYYYSSARIDGNKLYVISEEVKL